MERKGCLRKPLFAWMIWMVEIDSQQFFQRQVSLSSGNRALNNRLAARHASTLQNRVHGGGYEDEC